MKLDIKPLKVTSLVFNHKAICQTCISAPQLCFPKTGHKVQTNLHIFGSTQLLQEYNPQHVWIIKVTGFLSLYSLGQHISKDAQVSQIIYTPCDRFI